MEKYGKNNYMNSRVINLWKIIVSFVQNKIGGIEVEFMDETKVFRQNTE